MQLQRRTAGIPLPRWDASGIVTSLAQRRRFAVPALVRRTLSPLVIVLVWEIGALLGWIPTRIIAAPTAIIATAWNLTVTGVLIPDLLVSLARVTAGLAIGVTAGVMFALIAGLSRLGEDAVDPPFQMLRAIPLLGLTPLLILWFGIGEVPKLTLVSLAAFFPVYLTLFAGIRAIDPKLLETARVFGLDRAATIRTVVLPGAFPAVLVGLRQSLGIAWLSLVVAEQINADRGIGRMIMDARDFLRTDIIIVGLLIYAILGLATDALVRALERRALRWRPSILRGRSA